MSKFFVTTPIYYSNGVPHIGHAYSSLIADTLAVYHSICGKDIKFLTGVDENSQKVVESAAEKNMQVGEYADMMAAEHQKVWDGIHIGYTHFVRTSTPEHRDFVQKMLQKSYDNGDIYEGIYEGMYCVGCEAFKKESDVVNGKCPDHPTKELQYIKEKNYFFRLSRYQNQLEEFYKAHPDFIYPANRSAEIYEFVRSGLEDFSISRETNTYGIPLPWDPKQVTYVWYDALFNYMTYCQEDEKKWWPADIHVIGKDIARFHAIYWPAMLWSAGYTAPTQLLVTGHFTVNGQKMSKSIGNVIDPVAWADTYSRDALVLYLFTAFPIGQDGDFDEYEAILQYNAKLANNIGNLLNRLLVLSLKLGGKVCTTEPTEVHTEDSIVYIENTPSIYSTYSTYMDAKDLKMVLHTVFGYADSLNKYIDTHAPWKKDIAVDSEKKELEHILYTGLSGMYVLAYMMLPFFGDKAKEILTRIGTPYTTGSIYSEDFLKNIPEYYVAEKGEPLYTRVVTGE